MDDEGEVTPDSDDNDYEGSVSDTPKPEHEHDIQRQSSDNFSRTSVNSTSANIPNLSGGVQPEIIINDEAVAISDTGETIAPLVI